MVYPYPLGLPKGTVRATITLLLSVNLVYLTFIQSAVADAMASITLVSLTFYFGGRMRAAGIIPRDIDRSQRAWGLPAGSIRLILILLFGGSTYYFFAYQDLIPQYFVEVIYLIAGYLGGRIFSKFFVRDDDRKNKITDHLKALLAMGVTFTTLTFSIIDPASDLTQLMIYATAIGVSFYFGARE